MNLQGHRASWRDFSTTWLELIFSAQTDLTVITALSECVSVYALVVCTVSVRRMGLAAQIKPEARPIGEKVWVEGRATAEMTFWIKATSLWVVQVSAQLHFHKKNLKMQIHFSHFNYIFLSSFSFGHTADSKIFCTFSSLFILL